MGRVCVCSACQTRRTGWRRLRRRCGWRTGWSGFSTATVMVTARGAAPTTRWPRAVSGAGGRAGCWILMSAPFRFGSACPVAQGGRSPHQRAVGSVVHLPVAQSADADARRDRGAAGEGDSAGLSDLTDFGQPVHALRVRHLDGPGVPGLPVRALCRRRCCALRQRGPGPAAAGRHRRAARGLGPGAAPREDEDRVLQRREPPGKPRAHQLRPSSATPSGAAWPKAEEATSPASPRPSAPRRRKRPASRSGPGTSTGAAARTLPASPKRSTPRCEAGSTTTEPSTAPSCAS